MLARLGDPRHSSQEYRLVGERPNRPLPHHRRARHLPEVAHRGLGTRERDGLWARPAPRGRPPGTPYADTVIRIPDTKSLLTPLLTIVPMQVLSAEIARARGLDVDQPRNLAKSVTVE